MMIAVLLHRQLHMCGVNCTVVHGPPVPIYTTRRRTGQLTKLTSTSPYRTGNTEGKGNKTAAAKTAHQPRAESKKSGPSED